MIERNIFSRKLLAWFANNKRQFPWRNIIDPYGVLIAEIMLQRTRADQVKPVYEAFLKKYPEPVQLLEARLGEIKEIFSSLGLMWRAEKVEKLASILVLEYDGGVPENRKDLLR